MTADKLAKALEELPAAYELLPLFMLPGSRPDIGSLQHHSAASTRAPLVLTALDLADSRVKPDADPTRQDYNRDHYIRIWEDGRGRIVYEEGNRRQGVLPTLSSWVRLVDSELWDAGHVHAAPEDTPTVDTECVWLSSHVDWIGQQLWSDEITDDITGMLRDIRNIVGEDDKLAGKLFCIRPGCGWTVTERYEGAAYVCTGCGNTWSRLELHRMAERKTEKPITECARLAGVSEKTLQRYKAQGVLKPVRRQGRVELYDPDDVMRITMNLRYRMTAV